MAGDHQLILHDNLGCFLSTATQGFILVLLPVTPWGTDRQTEALVQITIKGANTAARKHNLTWKRKYRAMIHVYVCVCVCVCVLCVCAVCVHV